MKKLNRAKLIEELKLLAAGANGGSCDIPADINARNRFRCAIARCFVPCYAMWYRILDSYESMADEILAERKRLDAAKKMEGKS